MNRKTFVFHADWKDILKYYPSDLKVELYETIVVYATTGEMPELTKEASLVFPFFKKYIDEDLSSYQAMIQRNKANGKKGGRKPKEIKETQVNPLGFVGFESENKTHSNPLKPTGTQRTHWVSKEEEKRNKKEEENNNIKKEENNNINIITKEEKNFDSFFASYKTELLGEYSASWRESVAKKYGIRNHSVALDEFKIHIISQGKEESTMMHSLNEFKAYFANSARCGFLSDKAKTAPKETEQEPEWWRKPCLRLANRQVKDYNGKIVVVGVVFQDGKEFYTSPELGNPPKRNYYYSPQRECYYEDALDVIPEVTMSLPTDYYLKQRLVEDKKELAF